MSNNLESFGEVFISEVRDNTLEAFEKMFNGSMKGLTAQNVRDKIAIFDEQEKSVLLWLLSKTVDQCMYNMLFMLEAHEEIEMLYAGEDIVEESDGLSGELYTEDGWIEKYSKKVYEVLQNGNQQ
ncbi:MAG: hypothetical protein HDR06_10245 [Lachnospiraceae bacterium]|nr:hypothetical protein [Lachnospiraceae bacterium]